MTGELPKKMTGVVEADETYIGGKHRVKSRIIHSEAGRARKG